MLNKSFNDRLGSLWSKSRTMSGKSQDFVAKALGVSKKTVQNWENGLATPNLRTTIEWFDVLGVPMYPFIMSLLYPEEISTITPQTSLDDLKTSLHTYIDELDELHVRELLYLLYGSHGSSPTGTLDVVTAYLHLPLSMRICVTESCMSHYTMAESLNILRETDNVMPNKATLEKHVKTAREAVENGMETYTITYKEE